MINVAIHDHAYLEEIYHLSERHDHEHTHDALEHEHSHVPMNTTSTIMTGW